MKPSINPVIRRRSARQQFGDILRHYRDERRLDRHAVADIVRSSASEVEDWENGRAVPSAQQFTLLCKNVSHSLSQFRAQWQRAGEEGRNAGLSHRPFEVFDASHQPTTVVAGQEAVSTVSPTGATTPSTIQVPESLTGPKHNLGPAYIASKSLPKGYNNRENREKRREMAEGLLLMNPDASNDDIRRAVREKFHVGIGAEQLFRLRKKIKARQRRNGTADAAPQVEATPVTPKATTRKAKRSKSASATTPAAIPATWPPQVDTSARAGQLQLQNDIRALASAVFDDHHDLTYFEVSRGVDNRPLITCRTKRVIETEESF